MMRKIILILSFMVLLISFASAEILINKQPKEIYNLGEKINIPITVTSGNGIYDYLKISLNCENHVQILPKEEVSISPNEILEITKSIFLIEKFIGNALGDCKIKVWLQDNPGDNVFSNEFKILNFIDMVLEIDETEFDPGETVLVKGTATKENEQPVNGFVELNIVTDASLKNKTYQGIITEGVFSISFDLPKDIGFGEYSLKLNAYEKDPLDKTTNKGSGEVKIQVNQVPSNLELVLENQEVEPGTNLKVKAVLHDQTGEKIDSNAVISIKNNDNKVLEQVEMPTDEFLEFPILYNEPPKEWKVFAVSDKLSTEISFKIKEKEDIKVEIINKTIILTNIGNVPYNKLVLVKIGENPVNINTTLKVDEVKRYTLTAPDGEYFVEVITEGGSKVTKGISLTGDAINVKEVSSNIISLASSPLAWLFMIFILGFIGYMVFRKGYKKSFFGNIISRKKEIKPIFSGVKKNLIKTKNKAELSLSLSGEKQRISVICLKIKNFKEVKKNLSSVKETFEKIDGIVEENKVYVYDNNENLFFMFVPIITKTFDNEKNALIFSQKIERILKDHNKLFRQRIKFGISLNSGEIISKKEDNVLKFMSFGNLMINAKKIASVSESEIYLTEKIKDKIMSYAKVEKHKKQGVDFYTFKEIKGQEEHKKFITEFLKRLEKKSE